MDNIEILYYFVGDDGSIFIELKRHNYKKCKDKSKYVSWFKVDDNKIKKLNFVKMDDRIRFFLEGELIIKNNLFIENDKNIILNETNIDENVINLCINSWDK